LQSVTQIKELIRELLNWTTFSVGVTPIDYHVGLCALDCLSGLSAINQEITAVDKGIAFSIVDGVANNLLTGLKNITPEKERVISYHYNCMAEWLLIEPSLFEAPEFITKASQLIFFGLSNSSKQQQAPVDLVLSSAYPKKSKKSSKDITDNKKEESSANIKNPIRDGAFYLQNQLLNQQRNFPALPGVEFSSSAINETEDGTGLTESETSHFVYNDEIILSIAEVTHPVTKQSKNSIIHTMKN
jgi:hypothetical protein